VGCGYALDMALDEYRNKRRSGRSPEPHHAASTDHYDFRLETDGALVSWAVPKGPSVNPKDKRMARRTEDHPMEYESFEGVIPEGEYGAGRVIVWDRGTYSSDRQSKDEAWLLVKTSDEDADGRRKPVRNQPESVLSGRTLDELS
jgi:DNA polymerase Ligase (LigD)